MSTELKIVAIGPFSADVVEHMEYPSSYYENVPEGRKVVTTVVELHTRKSSEEAARCFGAELFSFATHYDCVPIKERLKEAADERILDGEDLENIRVLHEAGFTFLLLLDF